MPDENDLRAMLADTDSAGRIDTASVLRRARRRRRPKQLAAGAAGALALVGVLVVGVQTLVPVQQATMMEGGAPAIQDEAFESRQAPAEKVNLCEGALAEIGPSLYGLQLEVMFPPQASTANAEIAGAVTLTNTSETQVIGTTAAIPAITVSQGGVVLWHTNGPVDASAIAVDLGPGESVRYEASFVPVRCTAADEALEAFRADLPPLAPGTYDLSAAIDFTPVEPGPPDLVTGPSTTIELD